MEMDTTRHDKRRPQQHICNFSICGECSRVTNVAISSPKRNYLYSRECNVKERSMKLKTLYKREL